MRRPTLEEDIERVQKYISEHGYGYVVDKALLQPGYVVPTTMDDYPLPYKAQIVEEVGYHEWAKYFWDTFGEQSPNEPGFYYYKVIVLD